MASNCYLNSNRSARILSNVISCWPANCTQNVSMTVVERDKIFYEEYNLCKKHQVHWSNLQKIFRLLLAKRLIVMIKFVKRQTQVYIHKWYVQVKMIALWLLTWSSMSRKFVATIQRMTWKRNIQFLTSLTNHLLHTKSDHRVQLSQFSRQRTYHSKNLWL